MWWSYRCGRRWKGFTCERTRGEREGRARREGQRVRAGTFSVHPFRRRSIDRREKREDTGVRGGGAVGRAARGGTHRDEDVSRVRVDLVEAVAALEVVQDPRLVQVVERDHVLPVHVLDEVEVAGLHLALPGLRPGRDRDLHPVPVHGENVRGDVGLIRVGDPHLHPGGDGVRLVLAAHREQWRSTSESESR